MAWQIILVEGGCSEISLWALGCIPGRPPLPCNRNGQMHLLEQRNLFLVSQPFRIVTPRRPTALRLDWVLFW